MSEREEVEKRARVALDGAGIGLSMPEVVAFALSERARVWTTVIQIVETVRDSDIVIALKASAAAEKEGT